MVRLVIDQRRNRDRHTELGRVRHQHQRAQTGPRRRVAPLAGHIAREQHAIAQRQPLPDNAVQRRVIRLEIERQADLRLAARSLKPLQLLAQLFAVEQHRAEPPPICSRVVHSREEVTAVEELITGKILIDRAARNTAAELRLDPIRAGLPVGGANDKAHIDVAHSGQ
jgi:hypothetical protein